MKKACLGRPILSRRDKVVRAERASTTAGPCSGAAGLCLGVNAGE